MRHVQRAGGNALAATTLDRAATREQSVSEDSALLRQADEVVTRTAAAVQSPGRA